jgi:hypothetical protein
MAEPMNPLAGASGPSKFSARTDLPPSKEYGDRKQMQEIVGGAPTATTRGSADPKIGRPRSAMTDVTPLFAPSARADEPVTTGVDIGAGSGSEVMGSRMAMGEKLSDTLAKMLPFDESGEITILYEQALARGM